MWFFYIPLTAIVALALVTIPQRLLEQSVQPVELDAVIARERLFQELNTKSPVFGVVEGQVRGDWESLGLSASDKKWAWKVTVPTAHADARGGVVFGNREFFEEAVPLAPVRYGHFVVERQMRYGGVLVSVRVEEVYPKKYAQFS